MHLVEKQNSLRSDFVWEVDENNWKISAKSSCLSLKPAVYLWHYYYYIK